MYSIPSPELSDVGVLSKIASRPMLLKCLETANSQRSTVHLISIKGTSSLILLHILYTDFTYLSTPFIREKSISQIPVGECTFLPNGSLYDLASGCPKRSGLSVQRPIDLAMMPIDRARPTEGD